MSGVHPFLRTPERPPPEPPVDSVRALAVLFAYEAATEGRKLSLAERIEAMRAALQSARDGRAFR